MINKTGDNENGNVYYDDANGTSVFEDLNDDSPIYYAWRGTWDDHDTAEHSDGHYSMDAAIQEILMRV